MAEHKYYTDEDGRQRIDMADSYAENPTPQAAYAINKAWRENTKNDAFINAAKEAQKKGRAPLNKVIDDFNEKIKSAGRQADNEMKREASRAETMKAVNNKKGGKVCGMKKGGKVRGCGIAERGLTKGKMR